MRERDPMAKSSGPVGSPEAFAGVPCTTGNNVAVPR